MRTRELSGHIELEVLTVVNKLSCEVEFVGRALFDEFLLKDWFEQLVNAFGDIFKENWNSKGDRVFELISEVIDRLSGSKNTHIVGGFEILYPDVGLGLRIDHQRPSFRVTQYNSVVYGKGVIGEFILTSPLRNGDFIRQNALQVESGWEKELVLFQDHLPVFNGFFSVGNRESAHICDNATAEYTVSYHVFRVIFEVQGLLGPTCLFSTQSRNQFVCSFQLNFALVYFEFQLFFFFFGLFIVCFKLVQEIHDCLESSLFCGENIFGFLKFFFGTGQFLLFWIHNE